MAVIVVITWYTIGFLAAAHLVRRGHERTLWTVAAALTGALVALAAVALAVQRTLQPRSSLVTTAPPEVAVVVDRAPGPALESLARLDPTPESVMLLAVASHEATATWVDTGELGEIGARFAAHRTRTPLPTDEEIVTGGPRVLGLVGARLIVLPRDRTDRSRRHDAWRVLTAVRSSGVPVLSPASTGPTRPSDRDATVQSVQTRKAMA